MKRSRLAFLFYCVLTVAGTSCSSVPAERASTGSAALSLSALDLVPLHATAGDIAAKLGAPARSVPGLQGVTSWIYDDPSTGKVRATLVLDDRSQTLLSKTVEVFDGETEQSLQVLRKRYGAAKFKQRNPEWVNPHIAPDEVYFEDSAKGISIEMLRSRDEVVAITWFDPQSRAVAVAPTVKCTKFTKSSGLISCEPNP